MYCRRVRLGRKRGGREGGKQAPPTPPIGPPITFVYVSSLIMSLLAHLPSSLVLLHERYWFKFDGGTIYLQLSVLLSRLESGLKLFIETFLPFLLRTIECRTCREKWHCRLETDPEYGLAAARCPIFYQPERNRTLILSYRIIAKRINLTSTSP